MIKFKVYGVYLTLLYDKKTWHCSYRISHKKRSIATLANIGCCTTFKPTTPFRFPISKFHGNHLLLHRNTTNYTRTVNLSMFLFWLRNISVFILLFTSRIRAVESKRVVGRTVGTISQMIHCTKWNHISNLRLRIVASSLNIFS